MLESRIETTERLFGCKEGCDHIWRREEDGFDLGVDNNGLPWEEDQECYRCRSCGGDKIVCKTRHWVDLAEEIENEFEKR